MVELITVMTIVLFLASMLFANYHSGNSELSLELATNQVAYDIRSVQEMGMSSPQVPNGSGGYIPDDQVSGYGVHFKKGDQSYVIFSDTSGTHQYQAGGNANAKTINMDSNFYIKSVDTDNLSLVFLPPEPSTYINGQTLTLATITIASKSDPSLTRSIIVKKSGLIYVQ